MATSKVILAKRAAALKLKLHEAAVVLEQTRRDTEQHIREAAALEAALLEEHRHEQEAMQVQPDPEPEFTFEPVVPEAKRPWWKRIFGA